MTAPATSERAATVEFDHVTKSYDGRAAERRGPGRRQRPVAHGPGGQDLRARRAVGLWQDDDPQDGQPPDRAHRRAASCSTASTPRARDVTELRRSIGYVIQQTGLFPHQTIEENVVTVPRLLGWSKARMAARAEELLAVVGLEPATYAGRYPAQLSGGERQRVGVARALAADPPIMLMDEPFGAVDPIVRERLQNEFLRLQERLAKTILFVTHDIDEAIKMGDVVAVFETGGVVAQFGPPAEMLANPASDFVARFVGTDRGLKRLSLFRVGELPLAPLVTAPVGSDGAIARRVAHEQPFDHVLVVDAEQRPIGWVHRDRLSAGQISADQVESTSPLLDRRTTLKDALSMLLDADVQAGLVVDRTGAVRGMIGVEDITRLMREGGPRPADPPAGPGGA